MPVFTTMIDIAAPPERVWEVMRDVERWPEWTASMRSVQRLDGGPLRVGSRARIRQPKLPASVMTVTRLEQEKGFTWVARSPGVVATAVHHVEPVPAGSRVTLSVRFDGFLGPVVGWLAGGLTRRYIEMEAAGLKRRVEKGSTS